MYRMGKQQGPTELNRELCSIAWVDHNVKEYKKERYMYN